jgi:multiple sugar transport system substrate-binding protein
MTTTTGLPVRQIPAYNGSSIYFAAKKDKPDIAQDRTHPDPQGPAGRFTGGQPDLRDPEELQEHSRREGVLDRWFQDKQYGDWWRLQEGYMLQAVTKYYDDPTWTKDPKMLPFREQPKYGVDVGWPGPPNEKASLAWSKYIVVDTLAKAVQDGDAKAAVAWGAEQLKRAYKL